MRGAVFIFFCNCVLAHCWAATPFPARPVQTTDQARQLLVQGGTFSQRVAVLRMAGEIRETLLKGLFLPLESYPVARPLLFVLNPVHPAEVPASFQVMEDPGGVKLQVRLSPPSEQIVSQLSVASPGEEILPQLERTILAALMTELSLRPSKRLDARADPSHDVILSPPRWLMDALLHKHHHPEAHFFPARLRGIFETNRIPSPQLLLARPENDIRASTDEEVDLARCLLWMLSNRPESRSGLRDVLKTDFTRAPVQSLQKIFPSLGNTPAALQKEWTLAIAAYGTQDEIRALDGRKTQSEIERLLELDLAEIETGKHLTFPLEQFSDFLRMSGARGVLMARQLEWMALLERGHFLYSAVIETYANICGELARGKTAGIAKRLREATLERESVSARLSRIHDYVNWYQAVAAPRQNSLKIKEFYRILDEKPRVSEAVSRALDKAETQLREHGEQEDILRVIEDVRRRRREGNPP